MAFKIIEILDSQSENVLAKVNHQDKQVTMIIRGKKNDAVLIGKSFQAEMDYDEILDWKVINDFDDTKSAIWQGQDGIHLLGRVHSILDFGAGRKIIDVYMQNGPEFFTVNSDAIADTTLEVNTGLEIVVDNLYIYPTL